MQNPTPHMDFTLVVNDIRRRVLSENMLELARKLDVDYQRLGYFARTARARPDEQLLSKLFERYGYAVVAVERKAA